MKHEDIRITQSRAEQSRAEQSRVKVLGSLDGKYEHISRIYSSDGCSPTICTYCGGNHEAKVLDVKKIIKIKQATKEGFAELEIGGVADLEYPGSETRRGRVIDRGQVAPTTTTTTPYLVELGNPEFYNFLYEIDDELYLIRIRKLIPRECGRLMGVDDDSISKMLEINSNTQCYKQFGNSIVTTVLMGIFSQLGIRGVKKWNDMPKDEIYQMIRRN